MSDIGESLQKCFLSSGNLIVTQTIINTLVSNSSRVKGETPSERAGIFFALENPTDVFPWIDFV
jgi:hypothetical protein